MVRMRAEKAEREKVEDDLRKLEEELEGMKVNENGRAEQNEDDNDDAE